MANFPCNPMLFTPAGLHAQHGWHRPARARVTLGGELARRHEQYAVISLELEPEQDQVHGLLH
jgi:acyl-coenzyme A thioesterase PaaI-like protein